VSGWLNINRLLLPLLHQVHYPMEVDMPSKSYDEPKAEMEAIQQQMVEAKKNEHANALKEVKRLCKELSFTAGMLKGALAEGRKPKP